MNVMGKLGADFKKIGMRKSLDLYGAFAGGVNRLAEYAARVFGARCWRQQPGLGRGAFLRD
jgi:hypothetical protein